MAPRKNPEPKAEPRITDVAERTGLLIRGLQSRLRDRERPEETADDLERQLMEYFEKSGGEKSEASILNDIRNRVIDGVVERIMREWDRPQSGESTPIENEVVTRLIDRVLERLSGAG